MFAHFVVSSAMARHRQGWPSLWRLTVAHATLLLLLCPRPIASSLPDRGMKCQRSLKFSDPQWSRRPVASCRGVTCRGSFQRTPTRSWTSLTRAGTVVLASSTAPAIFHAFGTRSGAKGTTLTGIATASERPSVRSRCIASHTSHILHRASSVFEQDENWTSPICRYGPILALPHARDVNMCVILNVCVRYGKLPLPALPRLRQSKMAGFHILYPSTWGRSRWEERRVGKECRTRWSPYH